MMIQILGKTLPELVIMVGPSGAGKSKIAARTGYPVVSTDVIRTNLFGFGPDGKIAAEAYTPDGFRDTFTAARFIVEGYLLAGQNVVYDATNLTRVDRLSFLLSVGIGDGGNTKAKVKYYIVDRPLEAKLESYKQTIRTGIPVPHTSEEIICRHHTKMAANVDKALLGDNLKFVEVRDFR
jgi:predicted kinase